MQRYRVLAGDDRGHVKLLSVSAEPKKADEDDRPSRSMPPHEETEWHCDIQVLPLTIPVNKSRVSCLDVANSAVASSSKSANEYINVVWCREDGALSLAQLQSRQEQDTIQVMSQIETFPIDKERFACVNPLRWISCQFIQLHGLPTAFAVTNAGQVVVQPFDQPLLPQASHYQLPRGPARLTCLTFSPSRTLFAYGGLEADVSVIRLNVFLEQDQSSPKRQATSGKETVAGEIWKAKNVSNDALDLRTPVHPLNIVWVDEETFYAGQENGDVRKYSLSQRKPVSVISRITAMNKHTADQPKHVQHHILHHSQALGQGTQVKLLQSIGSSKQLIFADGRFSLGVLTQEKLSYTHKGQGAFQSIQVCKDVLITTNADRYLRIYAIQGHSKGNCLVEMALKTPISCQVLLDQIVSVAEVEDVWNGLRNVDSDAESSRSSHSSHSRSKSKDVEDFEKTRKASGKRKRTGRER